MLLTIVYVVFVARTPKLQHPPSVDEDQLAGIRGAIAFIHPVLAH